MRFGICSRGYLSSGARAAEKRTWGHEKEGLVCVKSWSPIDVTTANN
jgi:hypothetical protein